MNCKLGAPDTLLAMQCLVARPSTRDWKYHIQPLGSRVKDFELCRSWHNIPQRSSKYASCAGNEGNTATPKLTVLSGRSSVNGKSSVSEAQASGPSSVLLFCNNHFT